MQMTYKQSVLLGALNKVIANKYWDEVVDIVNSIVDDKDEYYDASFPPEIGRAIDDFALKTAWIYDRLETKNNTKRHMLNKIRKALGYFPI